MGFVLPLAFAPVLFAAVPAEGMTFNKDIAALISNDCSPCYRPGEAASFILLSCEDVAKKEKLNPAVTASRQMPPSKGERGSHAFRDAEFKSGWCLGEPDPVVEMPAAYHLPADGPDSIPVASGEPSKDETGSLTLIAVQRDVRAHVQNAARERVKQDPALAVKRRALMAN